MLTYLLIFLSKLVENALSTLRLILVSNGKKLLGSILQFICSLIWVISTMVVIKNLNEDILKIFFFAFGCLMGSYLGSILEEKLAIGNNMIICITSFDIMDNIRNSGYILTSTKGIGYNNTKNILFITIPRTKKRDLIHLLKKLDSNCFITTLNTQIGDISHI